MGGALVTVLWTWWTLTGAEWAGGLHPGIPGLATAGLLMAVVSLVTSPVREEAVLKFFQRKEKC